MYDPRNGWRPWPEPCRYDRDWLARYRDAQRDARRAHRRDRARGDRRRGARARERREAIDRQRGSGRVARLAQARGEPADLTIYRTLADPAYLDLTIDPDERPLGSLFAFPDPFDANYGRGWPRAHHDAARLALDLVGPVLARAARRHDAAREGPDADPAPDRRHRDPPPPGARDPRRRGRRRRHLPRAEGRAALPRGPPPRTRCRSSPTGSRRASSAESGVGPRSPRSPPAGSVSLRARTDPAFVSGRRRSRSAAAGRATRTTQATAWPIPPAGPASAATAAMARQKPSEPPTARRPPNVPRTGLGRSSEACARNVASAALPPPASAASEAVSQTRPAAPGGGVAP